MFTYYYLLNYIFNWKKTLACLACEGGRQKSSDNFLPKQKTSTASHNSCLGEAVDVFTCTILTSCLPPIIKENSQWKAIYSITYWTGQQSHTIGPWKYVGFQGSYLEKKTKLMVTYFCTDTDILSYVYKNPHYIEIL